MGGDSSSIQIQDDDTSARVSVVATTDDPTINGIVVCNPDGSQIGS